MKRWEFHILFAVLVLTIIEGFPVGPVKADMIYSNDFQGAIGPEWSTSATNTTPVGSRRFLGQFYNNLVTLTLPDLPSHTELRLAFDLFVLRSWDGNRLFFGPFPIGPDVWDLRVGGGPTLLHTTFAVGDRQAYPDMYPGGDHPGRTGAAEVNTLGYTYSGTPMDAVYNLSFTFPHSGASVAFAFRGMLVQPPASANITDESWGLDNVTVSTPAAVPEPSTLTLLGLGVLGLLGYGWRRRKRAGEPRGAA